MEYLLQLIHQLKLVISSGSNTTSENGRIFCEGCPFSIVLNLTSDRHIHVIFSTEEYITTGHECSSFIFNIERLCKWIIVRNNCLDVVVLEPITLLLITAVPTDLIGSDSDAIFINSCISNRNDVLLFCF